MKVTQYNDFVNDATKEILGEVGLKRENLQPMLSSPYTPNIMPIIIRTNGVHTVPEGFDGFNPVWVDVPQDPPIIQPLIVTQNGIYHAPAGITGYTPVQVHVRVYDWNLEGTTEQVLTDLVHGMKLQQFRFTYSENGITVSENGAYLGLRMFLETGLDYHLDIDNIKGYGSNYLWLFNIGSSSQGSYGLRYAKATNDWELVTATSASDATIVITKLNVTGIDYFDNHTLKFNCNNNMISVYRDDDLLGSEGYIADMIQNNRMYQINIGRNGLGLGIGSMFTRFYAE